jgi:hypothetical protein
MFIGGLNWETTEGMRHPVPSCSHVSVGISLLIHYRLSQELLHTIWRGQRMHCHARLCDWPLTRIRFPHLQRPEMRQHRHGEGALP